MGFTTCPTPDWLLPITKDILELERQISLLKWWQFKTKLELKSKLLNMKKEAFYIGMETALNDLEKMGLINRI